MCTGWALARWMNYFPRKMPDVRSRYARFTIVLTYVWMLRYMDECYGLFTTKTNHFYLERHTLRQMVTNRDALSVLLFVTIFHYSLENMSKFPGLYDAQFVGEIEDLIKTTDTPYKMHGENWYNFMTYKICHTMFSCPTYPKMYLNSILHHNQGQELHICNFVDTLLCTIGSARFTAQYA